MYAVCSYKTDTQLMIDFPSVLHVSQVDAQDGIALLDVAIATPTDRICLSPERNAVLPRRESMLYRYVV